MHSDSALLNAARSLVSIEIMLPLSPLTFKPTTLQSSLPNKLNKTDISYPPPLKTILDVAWQIGVAISTKNRISKCFIGLLNEKEISQGRLSWQSFKILR